MFEVKQLTPETYRVTQWSGPSVPTPYSYTVTVEASGHEDAVDKAEPIFERMLREDEAKFPTKEDK